MILLNNQYLMRSYNLEGSQVWQTRTNNLTYFEKFKHKTEYRIEIFQKVKGRWKLIYNEL